MQIYPVLSACAATLSRQPFKRRLGLAFTFGAAMALAMPPFDCFPLLWICLPALIFLLRPAANGKQAFTTGWCFAFGHMVFGLYWIAASMLVDIKHFWWGIPLAVAVLPACFAVYYGIAALVARRIGLNGWRGAVWFGFMWFLADYARGHLFSGFPWNLVGYAWSGSLPVLQTTSVIGIYGLSLLTTLAACLPASLTENSRANRAATLAGMGLFVALAAAGEARLQAVHVADVPDVRLRLVQPNTDEANKWKAVQGAADFQQMLDYTSAPADRPVTHVIWPEAAPPYYLDEDTVHRAELAQRISATASVLTGAVRRDVGPEGETRFYNSLIAIDGLGRVMAGYDKFHLVPFGEYMPFRNYLPASLRALAASAADFTPGPGPRTLRVLGLPTFSPLICYEAIFPGQVADPADRPQMLLNVTNDAWYKNTTGPFQHFAIARVRAIEEGLPLVRVDNTGISAVIDPAGRIVAFIPYGKSGFIDSGLPEPLPLTLYEKFGDIQPLVVILLLAPIVIVRARRKKI
ncbi:MAG: apolipoprotein N-acyltransferase [Alphaproteobacteria bacterium]|nr:apolipoprotein N-acyltransferase [Alphaproteobacteria bacterium]